MSESVVPLIICEGKTDWKHLKAAYRRLKAAGVFPHLDMEFLEFEEDVQMGDAELLRICRTYSKTPRDKPILCLFDRDNPAVLRQVVGEGVDYRAWGNEVYSFALPIPPCRVTTPEICVELLYSDEEIRLKDSKGRRLFLNSEFHRESGLHHSRDVHCLALNKIRRSALSIIDDEVFDRNSQNVALSKDAFANYVLHEVPPYDNLDLSSFVAVFQVVETILSQKSDFGQPIPTSAVVDAALAFSPDHARLELLQTRIWRLPVITKVLNPAYSFDCWGVNGSRDSLVGAAEVIESTLSLLDLPARIFEANCGPVFTQFVLRPNGRWLLNNTRDLYAAVDDLSLALATEYPIQIQYPLSRDRPECFGIVVKNRVSNKVTLQHVIRSSSWPDLSSYLPILLGMGIDGIPVTRDLHRMPHVTITGRTASGKSACVDSVLVSLLLHKTPRELWLVLADPTELEFARYRGLPHLLDSPIADESLLVSMLDWANTQAEIRLRRLSERGLRRIENYCQDAAQQIPNSFPYIVIVIDRLQDFMGSHSEDIKQHLVRLAQVSRSTGIHLVSIVEPSMLSSLSGFFEQIGSARVCLKVANQRDSVAALGCSGAEILLGRGDSLFRDGGENLPIRIQGSYVDEIEISRLVNYWKRADRKFQSGQAHSSDAVS